jgi:hypothetical protein
MDELRGVRGVGQGTQGLVVGSADVDVADERTQAGGDLCKVGVGPGDGLFGVGEGLVSGVRDPVRGGGLVSACLTGGFAGGA